MSTYVILRLFPLTAPLLASIVVSVSAVINGSSAVLGQAATWVGATGDFGTAANWSGLDVPTGTATLAGNGATTVGIVGGPYLIDGFTFNAGALSTRSMLERLFVSGTPGSSIIKVNRRR